MHKVPKHARIKLDHLFAFVLLPIPLLLQGIPTLKQRNILQIIEIILIEPTKDQHRGPDHTRGMTTTTFWQFALCY